MMALSWPILTVGIIVDYFYSCHDWAGLGFNMSFPVSSQDILKSVNTILVLAVIIDGAITLLWIPDINSNTTKKN